jgi:hypothetical protein
MKPQSRAQFTAPALSIALARGGAGKKIQGGPALRIQAKEARMHDTHREQGDA